MPRFTSYQETIDFMFSQLPMYQNVGKQAYKADLNNTISLLNAIGNPHLNGKWIHVAGTNGKGSVSCMLAATLSAHGYKTGLYTSPHLIDFTERLRIDGQKIDHQSVIDFMNIIYEDMIKIKPSFFEITVALAFYYFQKEQVDIGVIEVGLGGRLDSTNIINPILSVITNIGWDHMDLLGNTLPKIAMEKAGIIKLKTPVAIGPMVKECEEIMTDKATSLFAPIFCDTAVDQGFYRHLALKGDYQRENIQTFCNALEALRFLYFPIKRSKVIYGLENIVKLTGLRGRWEVICESPFVVCDTAHNVNGIDFTMKQLIRHYESVKSKNLQENCQLRIVWGMVSDKDRGSILALLPTFAQYYFCKPSVQRGFDSENMKLEAQTFHLIGESFENVSDAYSKALADSNPEDVIYIGGSTFVVGDLIRFLEEPT